MEPESSFVGSSALAAARAKEDKENIRRINTLLTIKTEKICVTRLFMGVLLFLQDPLV